MVGNWTQKGIENVKDSPKRLKQAQELAESLGGTLTLYYTMGKYDFVVIAEFPDDESCMQVLLAIGSGGNVRTETLKTLTADEAAKIIAKLP